MFYRGGRCINLLNKGTFIFVRPSVTAWGSGSVLFGRKSDWLVVLSLGVTGSALSLGRALFLPTRSYQFLDGPALGKLTPRPRPAESNNLPHCSNPDQGCWYPASSFNRPLHTFLTQFQRDQCSGSVQDQVIRAPENCKAIPEQLLLSQEWSELSVKGCKGLGWRELLGSAFISIWQRNDCASGKMYVLVCLLMKMWEREAPFTLCGWPLCQCLLVEKLQYLAKTQDTSGLLFSVSNLMF